MIKINYATEDYVNKLVKKLQWNKIIDLELEPKTKEYIFNDFDKNKNYQFYLHLIVGTGTNQISCLGNVTWLKDLPLIELRNNFHTDTSTDAMTLIFNPNTKSIIIKKRSKVIQDIQKIIIYEKEI